MLSNSSISTFEKTMTEGKKQTQVFASPEQMHLLSLPGIMESFPVVVGEYTFEKVNFSCPRCEFEIKSSEVKGRVDRSEPDMAIAEGMAFCGKCQSYSMVSFGMNSNGNLLICKDGEWTNQELRTSFWDNFSKSMEL